MQISVVERLSEKEFYIMLQGGLIFTYCKQFGELSVLMAQRKSLPYDLKLCKQLGYSEMEVEVDSWLLVHLIKTLALSVWPSRNL